MNYQNDDLRINDIKELLPPVALLEKFPATERAAKTVSQARSAFTISSAAATIACWW